MHVNCIQQVKSVFFIYLFVIQYLFRLVFYQSLNTWWGTGRGGWGFPRIPDHDDHDVSNQEITIGRTGLLCASSFPLQAL